MARTPKDVTDAELAVLEVLWDRAPARSRTGSWTSYGRCWTNCARRAALAARAVRGETRGHTSVPRPGQCGPRHRACRPGRGRGGRLPPARPAARPVAARPAQAGD